MLRICHCSINLVIEVVDLALQCASAKLNASSLWTTLNACSQPAMYDCNIHAIRLSSNAKLVPSNAVRLPSNAKYMQPNCDFPSKHSTSLPASQAPGTGQLHTMVHHPSHSEQEEDHKASLLQ